MNKEDKIKEKNRIKENTKAMLKAFFDTKDQGACQDQGQLTPTPGAPLPRSDEYSFFEHYKNKMQS